ncbi:MULTISPECIES: ClpP family protease [Nocardiopsis]|jgi:ATP-dependent Clp protease protease subunit|uniref:ATP-dependent Clp protease proteolytic subunit n=1 Tax=Nocardiopsis dassonvillei (strain ATCC 23218 / DSM 43111 / CIP 107115 / JCM 7437 / KCTC 9190 / NBRC 14626 / NCTC 10488 / NRRL B-5397 / IMRU 509) TaxID=446468 RepID=D7B7X1_NOCDD|nr:MULTISPECIES: ATP-dependent Clp protease proteolytic subunit [Nocardiopsis]ADH70279.1 Endopeptidase Clp [Nocardiopsis dassonvillei subsp. dassonvillei DSM 43111]APC33574.1 ATP-dependent Clp protease proteolytic subunit [Nocardiopsis dassonvillei]ASU56427.1 ATP-dependent Clp protease proteolytic subunit [Nocardiopsis dassonvillei]MCP3015618.1 ATP-dependent Clp protease proteolytic subunit [Nocardiopsis dassonvillei]NKY80071.1 ATP-dependent Clp protease proteolytic subunit [Nocardiopsis dasso
MPTHVAASDETSGGAFDDQLATRLLRSRIVLLGTQVDEASANRVCAQILLLADEDPRRDITLAVNSPGGSVSAGLAIYDVMNFVPNDVSTLVMGFAASMGQFLACVGTPGKRYSLPHARIMMHQPSGGLGGTAADIAIQAENLAHTKQTMVRLIAKHTGQTEETISRDQHRDAWFTAQEAREYGFVDHVVASVAEMDGGGIRLGAGAPGFATYVKGEDR